MTYNFGSIVHSCTWPFFVLFVQLQSSDSSFSNFVMCSLLWRNNFCVACIFVHFFINICLVPTFTIIWYYLLSALYLHYVIYCDYVSQVVILLTHYGLTVAIRLLFMKSIPLSFCGHLQLMNDIFIFHSHCWCSYSLLVRVWCCIGSWIDELHFKFSVHIVYELFNYVHLMLVMNWAIHVLII